MEIEIGVSPDCYGERMSSRRQNRQSLKEKVFEILSSKNLDQALDALRHLPGRQVINSLFSFLVSTDPAIKWAAVTAMGAVVAELADREIAQARVIVRRLMWQLNDESGGIGWGCPETKAQRQLNEICENYLRGCPLYIRHIAIGDPAREILKLIEKEKVDMVVMASHGRKGNFHFGSVTEKVVKNSSVPVVIIPVSPEK